MSDIQTHYEGCYEHRRHHACAMREIEKLKRERDEALEEAKTWKRVANNFESECVRRRKAIEDAPHSVECSGWCDQGQLKGKMIEQFCDCFKSEVESDDRD